MHGVHTWRSSTSFVSTRDCYAMLWLIIQRSTETYGGAKININVKPSGQCNLCSSWYIYNLTPAFLLQYNTSVYILKLPSMRPSRSEMVRAGFCVIHCLQINPWAVSVGQRVRRRLNGPVYLNKNNLYDWIFVVWSYIKNALSKGELHLCGTVGNGGF